MRTYDRVKILLEQSVACRNSDKALIWAFWRAEGAAEYAAATLFDNGYKITEKSFMEKATSPESITRARRKVQETHPHLRASEAVEAKRREKEQTKGTFIYN